jgi:Na+-driven multidrug efflux pump
LDPIFIFVFNWGVAGVSYATILSSLVTTLYLLYWYLSGKTRVILNFKYFKPGILYQIFIVAIPNFLTDSLWCILGLFFNKVLIQQLSQIGVLLYSTGSRIQSLMVSPQKALGRALLTVSGHLYGAKKFDELKWMYTYVIKISVSIALISSVVFFFIRDYGFALFSVSGAETSVFYIALAAIILIPVSEISEMSEKVLDGMGKSYYALVLTVGVILYEILLVSLLKPIFTSGVCVLLGILIGEITSAIVYYALFKYLSKTHGEGIKPHIIRGYSFKNQNV